MTDAGMVMNAQHFGSDPADLGSKCGLIRKSRFESQIAFG